MKTKQIVILLLALVFPVAIFIFLKSFGKNEFDVEPLYQKGDIIADNVCGRAITYPYFIGENELKLLRWSSADSLTLYLFEEPSFDEKEVKLRLSELTGGSSVKVKKLSADSLAKEAEVEIVGLPAKDIADIKVCNLLMKPDDNAVLVDYKRRLRGQYHLGDRNEADRLMVELKIILKKY